MVKNQARNQGLKYFRRGIYPDSGIRGKRMSEENISDNSDCQLIASMNPIAHNFVFNRVEDCEAGIISFSDGKMTFQGNADESAEIFLGYLKERYDFEWKELKQKRDALAAENAALKSYIDDECYIANPVGMDYIGAYSSSVETPATDAYLNSVRADAIESVVDALTSSGALTVGDSIVEVVKLAERIRAGKDGE